MNSNLFALPSTPKCFVVYERDGVKYQSVIDTPKDNHGLQAAMLTKKVGMSQVREIKPIQPRGEVQRPHPAQHRLAKYATVD